MNTLEEKIKSKVRDEDLTLRKLKFYRAKHRTLFRLLLAAETAVPVSWVAWALGAASWKLAAVSVPVGLVLLVPLGMYACGSQAYSDLVKEKETQ